MIAGYTQVGLLRRFLFLSFQFARGQNVVLIWYGKAWHAGYVQWEKAACHKNDMGSPVSGLSNFHRESRITRVAIFSEKARSTHCCVCLSISRHQSNALCQDPEVSGCKWLGFLCTELIFTVTDNGKRCLEQNTSRESPKSRNRFQKIEQVSWNFNEQIEHRLLVK